MLTQTLPDAMHELVDLMNQRNREINDQKFLLAKTLLDVRDGLLCGQDPQELIRRIDQVVRS